MTQTFHIDRLKEIQLRIQNAAEKSGRAPDSVRLIGVTKRIPEESAVQALESGLLEFGENRVQEAETKRALWAKAQEMKARRHLLGPLQTNKARKALSLFDMIQSVDRPRIAETLDRICLEEGKTIDCLIEVKISPEESKAGVPLSEAAGFIETFHRYSRLKLKGLMTIAPFDLPEPETRRYFREFSGFFDRQKKFLGDDPILSMGMTDDFDIAIEEGSTMVRIGRALFGERTP